VKSFDKLNLRIVANIEAMEMHVGSSLLQEIWKGQVEEEKIQEVKHNIKEEKLPGFLEDDERVSWYKGIICVPNIKELKDKILCEAHESAYSIHPGGNKTSRKKSRPFFLEDDEEVLWYKGIICVPNIKELKDKILCEAHKSAYSIHPGGNKMYCDRTALEMRGSSSRI
jgi:hypothetical protein